MKRGREWEGEPGPAKKIASDENRSRLDEHVGRRVGSPSRMPSPGEMQRRSSSEVRREDQRQVDESYHPSEAAHHPSTLPSIQNMPPHASGGSLPSMPEGAPTPSGGPPSVPTTQVQVQVPVKEEHARSEQSQAPAHEPAARKMDVDEDYDDDGDEDKKAVAKGSPSGSGTGSANDSGNGNAKESSS